MNLTEAKEKLEAELKTAQDKLKLAEIDVASLASKLRKLNKAINQAEEALK